MFVPRSIVLPGIFFLVLSFIFPFLSFFLFSSSSFLLRTVLHGLSRSVNFVFKFVWQDYFV